MANNSQKTVYYGSSKLWSSNSPVGSHGYTKEFSKNDWQVAFLSPNITPYHRFLTKNKVLFQERNQIHKCGGKWYEDHRIWTYVPWSLVSSKQFPKNWLSFSLNDFEKALKRNNISGSPDIIWIDNPEFGQLFYKYPSAKHVIRIADMNQYFKEFSSKLIAIQVQLAKMADLVIVTSHALKNEMEKFEIPNLVRVPNGVDLERFQPNQIPDKPEEFLRMTGPIALFVGMIEDWFDAELLSEVALKLPEVNFVLIGECKINTISLEKLSNVYMLGSKSPAKVPSYMYHSNIGIIPFKQNDFCNAINPVKYYEYIACGLPVVATTSLEFQMLGEPVYLASNAQEFSIGIKKALGERSSLREHLREIAKEMSWEKRWNTIMKNLGY